MKKLLMFMTFAFIILTGCGNKIEVAVLLETEKPLEEMPITTLVPLSQEKIDEIDEDVMKYIFGEKFDFFQESQKANESLETARDQLKSVEIKISEIDKNASEYILYANDLLNKAIDFVSCKQYSTIVSTKLLRGEDYDVSGLERVYNSTIDKLNDIGKELSPLNDNMIANGILDEKQKNEINGIIERINGITGEIYASEKEAERILENLKNN